MAKLTRKQKIQLAQEEKKKISEDGIEKKEKIYILEIIKKNYIFILGLIILCIVVYFNSLGNELTLVDDMQAIVYNEEIKDLPLNLKKLNLQQIVYSISYQFFQYNPLPLRIISVFLHTIITVLVFLFMYILFNKKHAMIASLIFAVHPINTEAVTWISGSPYLYISLFMYLIFLLFVYYKRSNKKVYLIIGALLYVLSLVLIKTPWVLVTPIAIIVLDQFFMEKKINLASMWWLFLFTIPVTIYLVSYFTGAYQARLEYRSGQGNRITMNAQSLKPVIEGYPYTITEMVKLYIFPKDLTVYYDGTTVTQLFFISMYVVFILYVAAIIYFWKKERTVAGILIILPVLVAPTMSPVKVTWFLAERYLYSGTAFFGLLVSLGLESLQQKYKLDQKVIWGIVGVIVVIFSIRTIYRNMDWKDTRSLSLANMKASPLSVRPYNDLGGYYYYKGDIDKAMEYYEKGLEVVPTSGTAINNLGYIYLEKGPLIFIPNYYAKFEYSPETAQNYFNYAVEQAKASGDMKVISYFLNKAVAYQPDNSYYLENLANFYYSKGLNDYAAQLFKAALLVDPNNEKFKQRLDILEKQ